MDLNSGKIIHLESVDSTNNYLKKLAAEGALAGTVVIADRQISGKGSKGRSFSSPKGLGLYFSYLLRPECDIDHLSEITAWAAVAASHAINKAFNLNTKIKWVNDLVISGKKVSGILTEVQFNGGKPEVIIGIGINVNHDICDFPEEIRSFAGSLKMFSGDNELSIDKLSEFLKAELDDTFQFFPLAKENILNSYRELSITSGKKVSIVSGDKKTVADAISIGDDFSLIVKYDNGEIASVKAGDVSVRGLYGYTE